MSTTDKSTVQSVNMKSSDSSISILLSVVSIALSSVNLFVLLKFISLLSPILIPAS